MMRLLIVVLRWWDKWEAARGHCHLCHQAGATVKWGELVLHPGCVEAIRNVTGEGQQRVNGERS